MSPSRHHGALTLLELLVALAILGAFIVLSGSWLVSAARASSAMAQETSTSGVLNATVQLLEDDLFEMRPGSLLVSEAGDEIQFESSHGAAGQRPGWASVVWSFDDERLAIVRAASSMRSPQDVPDERIVSIGVSSFVVDRDDLGDDGVSILEIALRHESGEARRLRRAVINDN